MAISRIKTFVDGEILTHTDLNAEFNNPIDNALSLISPLTGNLDAGNNTILNIGAAGTDFSGSGGLTLADALTVTAGGITVTAGDVAFSAGNLLLTEDTAASTAANQGGLYAGVNVGATELFMRGESDGTATLITSNGMTALNAGKQGYIGGLTLSNDTDTDHDINVTAGECMDSTNAQLLVLGSEMTKQIDATWAAGDDAGGLFSGTVTTDTWYHFFIIQKDSDGSIDAGFDTSVLAANIPSGYTKYRRVGSVLTNGSSNIDAFTQHGDEFLWNTPVSDSHQDNPGTSAQTVTLSTPGGVKTIALITFHISNTGGSTNINGIVTALDQADTAPSSTVFTVRSLNPATSDDQSANGNVQIRTNTSSQIRTRIDGTGTNVDVDVSTRGWIDTRGRFD